MIASPPRAARRLRVLIVDDESTVGRALTRVLRGYEVVHAECAEEALERLKQERFDAILCDLSMPGMDGPAFYEAVSQRVPDALGRIAFMTGGAFTERAHAFLAEVGTPRLDKPFDVSSVRAVVEALAKTAND